MREVNLEFDRELGRSIHAVGAPRKLIRRIGSKNGGLGSVTQMVKIVFYLMWRIDDCMKKLSCRILLRKEPEGGYTVIVPSLPGCVTYGSTREEAKKMAKEAIELYLESLWEHSEEIPTEKSVLEYTLMIKAPEVHA